MKQKRIFYIKNSGFEKYSKCIPVTTANRGFIIILLVFTIFSCKKYVTVDPPVGQLTSVTVFSTNLTATQAMVSVYADLTNHFKPLYLSGLSSDELISYSSSINTLQYYENALSESIMSAGDLWQPYYVSIYEANAIIEGVSSNTALHPSIVKQLTGEAKFIRAYCNFYLVNFFGDIPVVTTTSYTNNASLARTTQALVYKQIVKDLSDAESELNENYVDITDTTLTKDRVRPNKYAAAAMLARVYLYIGDYSDAIVQASKVIDNPIYKIETSLNNVFLRNSQEAIWQLQPSVAGYNTVEGLNFILTGPPMNETPSISNQLLNSFESGDNRKKNWIGTFTDTTVIPNILYYYSYKYKVKSSSTATEYSIVLRLAEQYLIRAECKAQLGDLPGALADLNVVHLRQGATGLQPITCNSQVDLLKAILHERQVELFTEGCQRWFDLKRMNSADSIMPGVTGSKGGVWSTNAKLYPIPLTERLNDPNLTQNVGY